MKRNNRLKRFPSLAAVLTTAATLALPGVGGADTIKVGVLLPSSGVFAVIGNQMDQALELGFDTFGREVNGRKIELIKADTETRPNTGLQQAKKLILQDKVDIMVGVVSSAVAGAVRDYVHRSQTPLIIANAGNDQLTGPRCSPWLIRTSFSNSQINREMGPWLAKRGVKTAFLMAFDYAAGHQMMEAFRASFTASGGEVVGEQYPPLGETKDFGPYLAKLKAAKPDAAYVFFAGGPAIKFVKEYEAFGLKGDIRLAGAGWLTSALYLDKEGPAAEGILGSLNYVPSIDLPENHAFQKAFQERFERVGSEFAVQAYDSARLIVEALKITDGKTDDRRALVDAMHQVSFVGPRGALRIDPKTNNVIQNIYIFEIRKSGDAYSPVVLDVIENVRDPVNGCAM